MWMLSLFTGSRQYTPFQAGKRLGAPAMSILIASFAICKDLGMAEHFWNRTVDLWVSPNSGAVQAMALLYIDLALERCVCNVREALCGDTIVEDAV